MISDSIPNASIPMASSSNHKDFPKKKRANRVAKLKQNKLDARREQWLSQVKNKGLRKAEVDGRGQLTSEKNVRIQSVDKIDTKTQDEEEFNGAMSHHYSDFESSTPNSPNSHTSSILASNDSGINFSSSSRSMTSCGQSSSSKSFCSENVSEDDEVGDDNDDDDGCLDDWEAMADALAVTDTKQQQCIRNSDYDPASSQKYESDAEFNPELDSVNEHFISTDISNGKLGHSCTSATKQRAPGNSHAWRPDDAYRPQSLPNLKKQLSYPLKRGGQVWGGCKNLGPAPTSCPVCCEVLDYTDSSFLPCPCGFRLCLFCHNKILEGDGRCPNCRKQYEKILIEGEATFDRGSLTYRLTRSCSMVTRS